MATESEVLCGICLDHLAPSETGEQLLECKHQFHTFCLEPWLAKRGTCPTCRFQVREIDESEDDEDFAEMQMDLMRLREAVMAFWGRRAPIPFHANVETIVRTVQLEREDQERHRQERGHPPMQEWASCVRIVEETDTEWVYEVDRLLLREAGRSLKNDVALVQSQTVAGFLTCIYAIHMHDNDIVNAIMEITYEI